MLRNVDDPGGSLGHSSNNDYAGCSGLVVLIAAPMRVAAKPPRIARPNERRIVAGCCKIRNEN